MVGGSRSCRARTGRCSSGESDGRDAYGDTILAVVDAAAVGKDMDVGTFGAELAVSL